MQRRFQLQALIAILSVGMMFSSCGNIDIVKRKYRPGFHVDISKKRQKTQVAEASSVADARKVETANTLEPKQAELAPQQIDDNISASTEAKPNAHLAAVKETRENVKGQLRSPDFKGLTFDRKMDRIKREVFKPTSAANLEWMKWVSFGTGIGSLAFGALAVIFSILTVVFWSSFVWGAAVLAILLGAAAITFSLIYKKNNGTDPKARLGFIFGIIGAGLGVLAIILGAIFFAVFVIG
ncbi:MAG: DUF308 domain-containing protein [Flavobacteriales bacterium]|nr:DUF308 domain-containing protein [Flavobacteriales bacterium]MCB9190918.1 DUF308 domain-containing protein [Flavobacteriales bacterium]